MREIVLGANALLTDVLLTDTALTDALLTDVLLTDVLLTDTVLTDASLTVTFRPNDELLFNHRVMKSPLTTAILFQIPALLGQT